MKDKEKQIEEMAKIMCSPCPDGKECFGTWCYKRVLDCANEFYNEGYRKIPKDSIVLTNDNAEELANLIVTSPQMQEFMSNLIKAWQKDTAEKIIRDLMNIEIEDVSWTKNQKFVDYLNKIVDKLEEFAKQFDIEI